MKPSKKLENVSVTIDYGYDIHGITVPLDQFRRVAAGEPINVQGQGFYMLTGFLPAEGNESWSLWKHYQ